MPRGIMVDSEEGDGKQGLSEQEFVPVCSWRK